MLHLANPKTLPKDGSDVERADYIACFVVDAYELWLPDYVVLEDYAHSRNTGVSRLGELGGVVKLRLLEAGYDPSRIIKVVSSSVKKFATGSGAAKKPDMVRTAQPWIGGTRFARSDDVADAVHIARYGMRNM